MKGARRTVPTVLRGWEVLRVARSAVAALAFALVPFPPSSHAQTASDALSGLTIIAFGEQVVDIVTGVTTLPEGGQVVDRNNDVTLTAGTIQYREGEFIEAESVELAATFGTARADRVAIDLERSLVDAAGNVLFEGDQLRLLVGSLQYDIGAGMVSFAGPVTGDGVELEAAAMLLDTESGVVLLIAPYRYRDDLFELSSDREGALLSLTPSADEPGRMVASSRVGPELLERFGPYLP